MSERVLDHNLCSASTGIHERKDATGAADKPWGLTYGQGELDQYGYWSIPCKECAREAEKRHGVPTNSYWPFGE